MNLSLPRRVMKIVPSRPAGGRLAWSLWLRGPQATYPRKNAPPKGPPQPEKGVSGEEPPPPSGGPGGSAPWCSFSCFLQRKQAPPRAVAPPEAAPPTVVAYGRQTPPKDAAASHFFGAFSPPQKESFKTDRFPKERGKICVVSSVVSKDTQTFFFLARRQKP